MNLRLSTAFTVSHRFWVVVFSFSFTSMHILISFFDFFCDFLVIQQRIVQPPYVGIFNMLSAAAKSLQSCPTLFDPVDGSPPGSSIPGILQARTLEWVAISFFNA